MSLPGRGRSRPYRKIALEDGVSQGVNYPIIMGRQVLGVVGITGEPAVVGQYGFLLTKICEVFLKEYRLSQEAFSEEEHRSRQVMALIYHGRRHGAAAGRRTACNWQAASMLPPFSDGMRQAARPGISVSSCLKPVKSWG